MIVYSTGWVLGKTPHTKETMFDVRLWIPVMGHNGVVLSYTISISPPRVDG